MAKRRMEGFQKPIHTVPRQAGKVNLARITEESSEDGKMHGATCSCGWVKIHTRKKVVTKAVDTHVQTKHEGRAIWL